MTDGVKSAVVGFVGRTNSGKSTLVNRIAGEKVSIVTPVVQTTRNTIRAILDEARGQLVLTDTPGSHKAESKLGKLINRMARHAAANVDILIVVFDASEPPRLEDDGWMRRVLSDADRRPCIFFLNKLDRGKIHTGKYHELWTAIQEELNGTRDVCFLEGSAKSGAGLSALVDRLFEFAPCGERLYDPEIISDYPRRLAIADAIREKLFLVLREELPHEVGVRVDEFNESSHRAWFVGVSLLVSRPSQKPIVLGAGGRAVRDVRLAAEKELSEQYGVRVRLDLRVKVARDWASNDVTLRQMGYIGEY